MTDIITTTRLTHAQDLRRIARMETRSMDYTNTLMLSSAEELDRLEAANEQLRSRLTAQEAQAKELQMALKALYATVVAQDKTDEGRQAFRDAIGLAYAALAPPAQSTQGSGEDG